MRNLTVLTTVGLVCGQAYAQEKSVVVTDSPVHAVPADEENGPVEDNAVPDTLNAQFAAQAKAPAQSAAPQGAALQTPAPQPVALQSRPEDAPKPAKMEGPSAAIAPRIIESAGAFEAYMRHAAAIQAKFADGPAVGKAMSLGAAYEITQFQEGATAYAALVALQDPAFVQGVYDLGRDPRDRADLAQRLAADPKSVMDIDGADHAAAMVSGILAQMGADLVNAGLAVKQSAYSVQHEAWSKEDVPNAAKRLADTKAEGAARATMSAADTDALMKTLVSLRKAGSSEARNRQPTPIVMHGLAIAALAVWGKAGEAQADQIASLLSDGKSADCMKMAKLNLYQCMAAAGPEYEDVFCLGAHALVDTGQCVIQAAGQTPIPAELLKASAPVSVASAPASISVPMALATTMGPERARAYAARPQADARIPAAPQIAIAPPREEPAPAPRDYAEQDAAPPQPTYAPPPRQAAPRDDYDDTPSYYDRAPAQNYDQTYDQRGYAPQSRARSYQSYRDAPYADPYATSRGYYGGYYGYGR